MRECDRVAGVAVDGMLLCPEHGIEELAKVRVARMSRQKTDADDEEQ